MEASRLNRAPGRLSRCAELADFRWAGEKKPQGAAKAPEGQPQRRAIPEKSKKSASVSSWRIKRRRDAPSAVRTAILASATPPRATDWPRWRRRSGHEGNRAQQHQEHRPKTADHFPHARDECNPVSGWRSDTLLEALAERAHSARARPGLRPVSVAPTHQITAIAHLARVALGERDASEHPTAMEPRFRRNRPAKNGRHHADDRELLAIKNEIAADYAATAP